MSVRFATSTAVAAQVPEVFDAALDIEAHLASMAHSGEQAIAGVTTGQISLAETVRWRARHFGLWWTMTSRITSLDRPHSFVDEQVRRNAWLVHILTGCDRPARRSAVPTITLPDKGRRP